ncbi:MAG TPA: DUF3368 domain-containing protein [Acidobacteriota bacterium]|jgi:hypothetical protein
MRAVCNASPLISLSAIHSLNLLPPLFKEITIPQAVFDEIIAGRGRPGAAEVAEANWIRVQAVSRRHAVNQILETVRLGLGESEAIVLAKEIDAKFLILDDAAARRAARRRGLTVIGTFGILLAAKQAGLLTAVAAPLQALAAAGKYISPATYREILRKAGEV